RRPARWTQSEEERTREQSRTRIPRHTAARDPFRPLPVCTVDGGTVQSFCATDFDRARRGKLVPNAGRSMSDGSAATVETFLPVAAVHVTATSDLVDRNSDQLP